MSKAIDAYTEVASAIPDEPAKDDDERRSNMEKFEEAFKKVMKEADVDANAPFLDDEGPKMCVLLLYVANTNSFCRLICTSNTLNASNLHLVRSYRTRGARPAACSILQAACASIASHDLFFPITIGVGHRRVVLASAIVGYANPTKVLLREAEEVFGAEAEVATMLSIGAGGTLVSVVDGVDKGVGISDGLLRGILSSKQVHEDVQMRLGETRVYFRLNVDHELCTEPELISAHISDYLNERAVSARLDEAIKSIEGRPKGPTLKDISKSFSSMMRHCTEECLDSVRIVEFSLKPRPPLVENFIGRQDILDTMRQTHINNRSRKAQSPAITILFGLGGSGKTQTALKFALDYENLCVHLVAFVCAILKIFRCPNAMVFFLNARSEEDLQEDLETLVRSRGPECRTKTFSDALVYLSRDIKDWLVIFDNADNPSARLFPYIPTCAHGNVIITTRNANHALLSPDSSHHLEGLSTEDAVKLILTFSRYNDTTTNREVAERIVLTLGHLPLALSQAGAYIYVHKCLSTYLEIYRKSKGKLLSTLPWELPSNYPASVATTIRISFEKLSQDAQDVIRLFSRLDSTSIAYEIIARAALAKFRTVVWTEQPDLHPRTLALADALCQVFCPSGEWLEVDFNEIITQCLQYSLLRLTSHEDSKFYSMHVLVQSYLRLNQEPIRGCEPGQLVVRLLGSSIVYDEEYPHMAFDRLVIPHARIINTEDVVEAGDLFGFGTIFYETGNLKLSATHWERCLEMIRSIVGEEYPATFVVMGYLSNTYSVMGKHEKATELGEKALEIQKRVLGPEHGNTLRATTNFAETLRAAGRHHDALQLVEGMLEVQKRVLGPYDVATLTTMTNISDYYILAGRYKEALELKKTVVDSLIMHLGLDHPFTLEGRGGLAACYWNLLMGKEALELNQIVLESQIRILGSEHPNTLHTIRNHFTFLHELGMTTETFKLVESAVPAHERGLGMDHPTTIKFKDDVKGFIRAQE